MGDDRCPTLWERHPISNSGFILKRGAHVVLPGLRKFVARPASTCILTWVRGAWSCFAHRAIESPSSFVWAGPARRTLTPVETVVGALRPWSCHVVTPTRPIAVGPIFGCSMHPASALIGRSAATPVQKRSESIGKRYSAAHDWAQIINQLAPGYCAYWRSPRGCRTREPSIISRRAGIT